MTTDRRGHHRRGMMYGRPTTGERPPGKTTKRMGIQRQPRERTAADLPITWTHEQVLDLLTLEPQRVVTLVPRLGPEFNRNNVVSALYVLQDRGFAERIPGSGWKLR